MAKNDCISAFEKWVGVRPIRSLARVARRNGGGRFSRLPLGLRGALLIGIAIGNASAAEIKVGDQRWVCERLTADGKDCLGKTTVHLPNGNLKHVLKVQTADGTRCSGPQREEFKNGGVLSCAGSSPALCACTGESVLQSANGNKHTGTTVIKGGKSVWVGKVVSEYANGDREECEAAQIEGAGWCNGATTYVWASSGTKRVGTMRYARGKGEWVGSAVWSWPNGDKQECTSVAANGFCNGDTVITFASGERIHGRQVGGAWNGRVTKYTTDSRQFFCDDFTNQGGCKGNWVASSAGGGELAGPSSRSGGKLICEQMDSSGRCDGPATIEYADGTRVRVTYRAGQMVSDTASTGSGQTPVTPAAPAHDERAAAIEAQARAQAEAADAERRARLEEQRRIEREERQQQAEIARRDHESYMCRSRASQCRTKCSTNANIAGIASQLLVLGVARDVAGHAEVQRKQREAVADSERRCLPGCDMELSSCMAGIR